MLGGLVKIDPFYREVSRGEQLVFYPLISFPGSPFESRYFERLIQPLRQATSGHSDKPTFQRRRVLRPVKRLGVALGSALGKQKNSSYYCQSHDNSKGSPNDLLFGYRSESPTRRHWRSMWNQGAIAELGAFVLLAALIA
jgi:hypothetical protein